MLVLPGGVSLVVSSSGNFFATERELLYSTLYPPFDHGSFRSQLIVISSLASGTIFASLVYFYLHFVYPPRESRPKMWLFRRVRRGEAGTLIATNLRVWCVLGSIATSACVIGYCHAHLRVYLDGAPQSYLGGWRAYMFIPIAAVGWLISFSSLQSLVLCLLDLGVRPVPIPVWNLAFVGGGLFLLSGGFIAGSFYLKYSLLAWRTVARMLELLAHLATETSIPSAELLELNSLTLSLEKSNNEFQNTATVQYSFLTALCTVTITINAAGYVLSRLMQQRISRAEHDLAQSCADEVIVPLSPKESAVGLEPLPSTPTAVKGVSLRELRKLAKPSPEPAQQGEDCSRRERAEAVLAMKKAAMDVQLVTGVIGLTATTTLGFLVYLVIYAANGWLTTRDFRYYQWAAFGSIWPIVLVSPISLVLLCINEWRYRHSPARPSKTAPVAAHLAACADSHDSFA